LASAACVVLAAACGAPSSPGSPEGGPGDATAEPEVATGEAGGLDATKPADAGGSPDSEETGTVDAEGGSSKADADADAGAGVVPSSLCRACPSGQKFVGAIGSAVEDLAYLCVPADDPLWGCANASDCNLAHALATCDAAGDCAIASCRPGWADCDGVASNGCEADLTQAKTCGSCKTACSGSTPVCSAGTCASSCASPATNCNGSCADLKTSASNCGACGKICSPPQGYEGAGPTENFGVASCTNGTCGATCDPGELLVEYGISYSRLCLDPARDPTDCGGNGRCPRYNSCVGGKCTITACPFGEQACNGTCRLTSLDPANCGACGNACAQGLVCQAGSCVTWSSLQVAATSLSSAAGFTQQVGDVFIDGPNILYTDLGGSAVYVVPLAGGSPRLLASKQNLPLRVTGDGTYAYWINHLGNTVMRAREDGTGPLELLYTTGGLSSIAVDANGVYWDAFGSVYRAPKTGVPDGGAPVKLGSFGANEIALSDGVLYVNNFNDSNVYAIPLPNGPPAQVPGPIDDVNGGSCDVVSSLTVAGGNLYCWSDPGSVGVQIVDGYNLAQSSFLLYPEAQGGEPSNVALASDGCAIFVAADIPDGNVELLAPNGIGLLAPSLPAEIPVLYTPAQALGPVSYWTPKRLAISGTTLVFSYLDASGKAGGVAKITVPE
jgi:hypothetical protein